MSERGIGNLLAVCAGFVWAIAGVGIAVGLYALNDGTCVSGACRVCGRVRVLSQRVYVRGCAVLVEMWWPHCVTDL